jgi:hypothetical protein
METSNTQQGRDPELLAIARKRASFKYHLFSYVVVNAFLWALWYFTEGNYHRGEGFPWPFYSSFGWGIGVFFHFTGAYVFPKNTLVDREYEKLIKERK